MCQKSHVCAFLISSCIIILILGLGLGLSYRKRSENITELNSTATYPGSTLENRHVSYMGTYSSGAVASDGKPCAKIGT